MKNVLPVLLAATVLACVSTSAAADPPPLLRELSMDLDYKLGPRTKSCYLPHEMELRLIGAFRYDPFDHETSPELHVSIEVDRKAERFHAKLTLTLADGRRLREEETTGANCVQMLSNVALIAATHVLIYVLKVPNPPSPAPLPLSPPPLPPPAPLPTAASKAPISIAKAAPPPAPLPDPWRVRGMLGAEFSLGLVRGSGVGASAGGGVQWGKWLSLNVDLRGLISPIPEDVYGGHSGRWYFLGSSVATCVHVQIAFVCPAMHAGARGWLAPKIRSTTNSLSATATLGLRFGIEKKVDRVYSIRAGFDVAYLLRQKESPRYQDERETSGGAFPFVAITNIGFAVAPRPIDER